MRHGAENFQHIITHFYGHPWAILPSKLDELQTVLIARINGVPRVQTEHFKKGKTLTESASPTQFQGGFLSSSPPVALIVGSDQEEEDPKYRLIGNVALIRVNGVISSRASLFDEYSGGSSHDAIGLATDQALSDGKVESIVYDIDSPGGTVLGMPENAAKVFAAKKTKPTTAIANHLAASAAYWYLSQAQTAVVTPAGQVGCIGVLSRAVDQTEFMKAMGVKDILVSNTSSPFKAEGYPQVPFTEEQRAEMQATCNKYAQVFMEAIAKGRNVRVPTVEKNFGQGRVLLADDALAANMVDKIGTLETVVNDLNKTRTRQTRRNVTATLANLGLPIN